MKFEVGSLTYEMVKKDAKDLQDACNPIAVANYLVRASKVVSNDKGGFDALREDPYIRAIVGKLCDLYNIDHDWKVYECLSE